MKILLLCNKAPFPPQDGSAIAVSNMAKGMVQNKVEVDVLAINTKKHFKADADIAPEILKSLNYQSVFHDTDVTLLGALKNLFTKQSYFVSRFYFKAFKQALIQKLKTETFDFIQLEGVFMASYIPIIRKHSKAKIILRSHNVEYIIWERYIATSSNFLKNHYLKLQKNRLKKFELKAFREVDAIVPITDVDAAVIKKLVPKAVIYPSITGTDLSKYQFVESPKEKNTIFYFGSMDWLPNIEAVEWFYNNCWQQVKTAINDVKWVIAGKNMPEHIAALGKFDAQIEIQENVASAVEFYHTYNIMLAPILSGSGLRIKLVEGISYGKPIVTTSIGMEGLHCKHQKELLIADTSDSFAEAVIELLKNESLQTSLRVSARKYAKEHFDNDVLTRNLLNFYKTM